MRKSGWRKHFNSKIYTFRNTVRTPLPGENPGTPKISNRQKTAKKYIKQLKERLTVAEKHLWNFLKPEGFQLQVPVYIDGGTFYILDFYHPKVQLAIEVDGQYHNTQEQKDYDLIRDDRLKSRGIYVLRFTNESALNNTDTVFETIISKKYELGEGKSIHDFPTIRPHMQKL